MPRTETFISPYGSDSKQAVVILPGYAQRGDFVAQGLLDGLEPYGMVKVVNYGDPFDANVIVDQIFADLAGFERVAFLGQSMGSIIARMAIDRIVYQDMDIKPSIVVFPGISDASDIVMPVGLVARGMWWPLTNRHFNHFINLRFDRRAAVLVERDVDRRLVYRHRRSLWNDTTGRARRAQLRLMAGARRANSLVHRDVPSVYIRGRQVGDNDSLVYSLAADRWLEVFPGKRSCIIDAPELWHGTAVEQPQAHLARLEEAFDFMRFLPVVSN